jgi:hypothetical protein
MKERVAKLYIKTKSERRIYRLLDFVLLDFTTSSKFFLICQCEDCTRWTTWKYVVLMRMDESRSEIWYITNFGTSYMES